jgi:hypothetical protein
MSPPKVFWALDVEKSQAIADVIATKRHLSRARGTRFGLGRHLI